MSADALTPDEIIPPRRVDHMSMDIVPTINAHDRQVIGQRVFIGPLGTMPGGPGWRELPTVQPMPSQALAPVAGIPGPHLPWRLLSEALNNLGRSIVDAVLPSLYALRAAIYYPGRQAGVRRVLRRTETPARSAMHAEYRRKTRHRNRNRGRR